MERLIRPEIDIFNSFTVDNFLDTKYKDEEWACPVLPRRTRLSLTNIGKFKSPFIENKTIKIYVDKKDDSLWYYNPALYNGYGTMIDGTSGYFSLAGWSRVTGVRKLLEQGYTPLEIKSALAMYVLEVDRDITQLYEDILLEALQMYSKYLNEYEARNG